MKKPVQNAPVGISTNVEVPFDRHSARSKVESQNLIIILREVKRTPRIYWRTNDGFCNSGQKRPPCRMTWSTADNEFKDSKFCEIDQLPKKFRFSYEPSLLTNGHSARSEAKSQNLIVILRIVKRSPRIYLRTDDGFCISGQKRPPCRMTRWMADNEFKNPRFCQVHELPRIFKFSYELSLLTLSFCAKRSEVAESIGEPSNCHSAWSETESQNLLENHRIVILREVKRNRRI